MITVVLVLARTLHIGSAMMLVALPYFMLLILRPIRDSAGGSCPLFRGTLMRWLWVMLILEALSGAVWFWFVAAQMSDQTPWTLIDQTDLKTALWQTEFGRLWLVRAAIGIVLVITLYFVSRKGAHGSSSTWCLLAISSILLITLAWAGHADAGIHHRAFHLFIDILHLFIGSIWPVGLIPLGLFLRHLRSRVEGVRDDHATKVLLRFSRASLIAVFILVITGFFNGWLMVGTWQALVTTTYGELLLAKVVVVMIMIGLGTFNRLRLLPRIKEGSLIFRSLRATILLESCLAMVVLLIVGLMGMTAPPP